MMSQLIRGAVAKGNRCLVIAHRRELITQAHERFAHEGIDAGIIMAGHEQSESMTQVASIQTLSRRKLPEAKILCLDECHHAKAAQYEKLLSVYPEAIVVGLTASPWRLDGRGLGDIFQTSVVAATPHDLIRDGYLCGYTGFAFQAPDLSEVKTVAGDWDEAGLSFAYQRSTVYADIIEKWHKHAQGRQTIVFAASIQNSKDIVERFRGIGVRAAHVDYQTDRQTRVESLLRLRRGDLDVVSNVGLYSEGVDIPSLSCAILARPTKSLTVYLQQVGRVMRPKADGSKALILDHAGNVERHGLPDAWRDYSLVTTKPKEVVPSLFTCPQCFAISEHAPCPECGHQPVAAARSGPDQQDEHTEVPLSQMRRNRDSLLADLEREAKARGRAPGWCIRKLKQKMPDAPFPASWWRSSVEGHKGDWRWTQKLN